MSLITAIIHVALLGVALVVAFFVGLAVWPGIGFAVYGQRTGGLPRAVRLGFIATGLGWLLVGLCPANLLTASLYFVVPVLVAIRRPRARVR